MRRLLRFFVFFLVLLGLLYVLLPILSYTTIPSRNTSATHFDTLIVLGHPAAADGKPDPEIRERVEESVREYRAGIAPRIIMSGASAHNRFVEAQIMAELAEREAVPKDAIVLEPQALDTIQNIWYARQIMMTHGWTSAEIISSSYHLPRTALILEHYNSGPLGMQWRTHSSQWPPEYGSGKRLQYILHEALGTVKLRLYGFGKRRYLP